MSLQPLLLAAPAVQVHVAAVSVALALSGPQLLVRMSRRGHRFAGYAWILSVLLAALSSFFIHGLKTFGPFSLIHVLSLLTLAGVWAGWRAARQRDIRGHRKLMILLTLAALVLPTALSLSPGRILYEVMLVW